jgi:hypothetical protein
MSTQIRNLLAACLMLPLGVLYSQMDKPQPYWVHEDVVKPSMVAQYEAAGKELISKLKEYNIQDAKWIATALTDNRYLFVSEIENMASLDKHMFATLADKMGADALSALFAKMDKCYDVEHDYLIYLDKDLSYMPEGLTQTPEGQDYRKFYYLYVTPANRAAVKEKMKAVKNLFASKGSKEYFRIYHSGFGTRGEFYMAAVAAKDAEDYAKQSKANDALLGEEGKKAFGELFSSTLKNEDYTGMMRPDLYYIPSN